MPPTIPAIMPEIMGAPEAKAIPRHKGKATRKTTTPERRSFKWNLFFSVKLVMRQPFIIKNN
ncbi:hypothetical protein GCM10011446_15630 [Acinetobacter vivianii]|nr:hypothetical protein GCM10011446_15630 [Acinetobacter vivianii]